jgi:hypothetical protein
MGVQMILFLSLVSAVESWEDPRDLAPVKTIENFVPLAADDFFAIDDERVNMNLLQADDYYQSLYSFRDDDFYGNDDFWNFGEDDDDDYDDESDFYQRYVSHPTKYLRTREPRILAEAASAWQKDVSTHPFSWVFLSLSVGVFLVLLATLTLRPIDMRTSDPEERSAKD